MSGRARFLESVGDDSGSPFVFDRRLRPVANELLARPASAIRADPKHLTAAGLAFGLVAGLLASQGWWWLALLALVVNRLFDGLDGVVSRQHATATDSGAYLDIIADATVFITLPLGVAIGHGNETVWLATAVLLGSFAVNLVSWSHLSALLERRRAGASATGELTTVTMPDGLVEGTETMVWFVLFLVVPDVIVFWMLSMAIAVSVGVALRVRSGLAVLDELALRTSDFGVAIDA